MCQVFTFASSLLSWEGVWQTNWLRLLRKRVSGSMTGQWGDSISTRQSPCDYQAQTCLGNALYVCVPHTRRHIFSSDLSEVSWWMKRWRWMKLERLLRLQKWRRLQPDLPTNLRGYISRVWASWWELRSLCLSGVCRSSRTWSLQGGFSRLWCTAWLWPSWWPAWLRSGEAHIQCSFELNGLYTSCILYCDMNVCWMDNNTNKTFCL